ncbi:protein ALTERED PHOSPHATE STARVATION RESPONSE 1-like [Salvia hispanica]|uniref:protein ALTERED PHOSPHATE STARVATION RESPONSE 1-like n=1 Tax=Salvia hispanica TaxID=49212 RepID=UPI0020099FC6|nr:protein ALTERED PHOSPHATE STARVATION RESPONSE 1-like [Salvia hispanica]XP_047941462.1 protein ALTERED PHOSPHATE STARVATION RESPONSE 1-like [Salvia hispanica]
MGCAQSKIDNEESVSRCKERRNLMKEAVVARNAFASAHSGYSVSLKDTGAALSDFAGGEVPPPPLEAATADPPVVDLPPPPPPSAMGSNLPPPPPPLPSFSPMPTPPLQRAVTMPALSESVRKGKMKGVAVHEDDIYEEDEVEEEEDEEDRFRRRKKGVEEAEVETPIRPPPNPSTTPSEIRGMAWDYFFMDNTPHSNLDEAVEGGDGGYGEEMNGNLDQAFENVAGNDEFKTPEKQVGFEEFKTPEETPASVPAPKFMHSNTAPPAVSRIVMGGNAAGNDNGVDLLKVLSEIDDHFLKASQSSQAVSKMLEATRLHYHSNFADNRGHIDHAARVMQVITWNKSFKGVPNGEAANDSFDPDDYETHATVLDKLLAWEKKLYEEIKAGELMKREYQRKVGVLNKLKKRNASAEQVEKAKAAVSHLHTRYIVDMQSLDSTVSEVNDIRDKQLFPKLVSLVQGMTTMWESMCIHHNSQLEIVTGLKSLDISGVLIETTKHHHDRTKQLATVLEQWHSQFDKLVTGQRQYIGALSSWLKLNLIPIESSLKEKVSSPPRAPNPPIQPLLRAWHDYLEKLPDEVAKSAIASFAAVIKTIILHQEEEMKLKDKYDETRREYIRKKQAFEEWVHKYRNRRTPPDEGDAEKTGESGTKDPVTERQFVVESLKKRMEEEMEEHQKHCIQVREKSLGSLKIRLPEIFRALSDYANACYEAYEQLRLLTASQHPNPNAGA